LRNISTANMGEFELRDRGDILLPRLVLDGMSPDQYEDYIYDRYASSESQPTNEYYAHINGLADSSATPPTCAGHCDTISQH